MRLRFIPSPIAFSENSAGAADRGRSGGRPAAAVDYDKQDRLRNTAAAFMRVHKRNGRIPVYSRLLRRQRPRPVKRLRFDVIEVYLDGKGGHTVNHIPNAF